MHATPAPLSGGAIPDSAPALRFVPWEQARSGPHVVVDGAPSRHTVLTLSHWPNNATPGPLKRDTSTACAFAWLDAARQAPTAEAVTNNHFDEDGLFAMFAMCRPEEAWPWRALLEDASRAGDFGVFRRRDAARLVFAIEQLAAPGVSPLPERVFAGCEARRVASLYRALLERLPELIADLDGVQSLWDAQDRHLERSLAWVASGRVRIDEDPQLDLAVVQVPAELPECIVRRYLRAERTAVHPFALHTATRCNRLLRIQGRSYSLQYRYESWVQMATCRPALRVDLEPLAATLNARERAAGRWRAEPVDDVAPQLWLDGAPASSLSPERFVEAVRAHLASAPVAWDPYDWRGD